ncbi:MAG: 4Fe-4S dicluster domain-containing protein [Ruminococcaceae bacterium]|nr:4Fe-4S dicluster domain-containing protein [Oscillospiraceae bacterium]
MNKTGFGFLRLPKKDKNIKDSYDWEEINKMVDSFMELGGKYFDTCYTYLNGYSEYGIRECVTKRKDRDTFILADKLPGYNCKCYEDCRKFFDEELERCGVTYFDVYMLHWLNQENYNTAEKYDQFRFLREVKESEEAKQIGFSYHDSASLLDEILTKHPEVDVVQLQINYLDWDTAGIESRKCYETCVKHGKKVIVMEPIKGGTLASLPEEAESLLKSVHPEWTSASWALRFVQSLPEVIVCLSGMSSVEQVEENMCQFDVLTESDIEYLWNVRDIIERNTAVPCTGCRYCVDHCPMNIRIPDYFKMFNELSRYPNEGWKIKPAYGQAAKGYSKASDCISCGACESHCPQNIKIPEQMKSVAEKLG